ncbi:MAG: SURF1 family protein [Actinomycetales bacterium]
MLRFLFTRRWLSLLALALAVAVGCLVLARWQWHRREQRVAANHLIETNYDQAPVPLDSVAGGPDSPALTTASTWLPVRVHGEYLAQATTLVRNRPLDSQPGFYVLVPLRADDGAVWVVNRGWVPTGRDADTPDSVPAPPTGPVEVVSRVQLPENPTDQDAPAGQAYRIVPTDLAPALAAASGGAFTAGDVIGSGYGLLADETPAAATNPQQLPRPPLDEGPHLSYSVQWVIFALGALVGFGLLVRRTWQDEQADAIERGETPAPAPLPASRRSARRGPSDEEVEDAAVDAALEPVHPRGADPTRTTTGPDPAQSRG